MEEREIYKIVCSDGKRRNAYKIVCEECGKEHFVRIRKNRHGQNFRFCSGQCATSNRFKDTRRNLICAWCKTPFVKHDSKLQNSKSGLFFCCRKCKDEAQKLGGIKEIQPPHFGTASPLHTYRRIFVDNGGEFKCKRCGYDEFENCVEVHHIDHNRENNHPSNLMPLCCNCHNAYHYGHITL